MNTTALSAKAGTVVFVHGLWMTGFGLMFLRQKVAAGGFQTEQFSYHTVSGGMEENVEALHGFLTELPESGYHLVGHSLGGLLILHHFERFGPVTDGRVIFLGSPLRGSQAARALASRTLGKVVLGRSARESLLQPNTSAWSWPNPLGIIAGTGGRGVGRALSELPEPNDGTVAVEETRMEGATDHVELEVSHSGMLVSRPVAEQIIHFIRHAGFQRPEPSEEGISEN